jgi:hypothetical protein
MKKTIMVFIGLWILSATTVLAQSYCNGNFDADKDVDGSDASTFKSDFGRSGLKNPCPPVSTWKIFQDGTDESVPWVDYAPNTRFAVFDAGVQSEPADDLVLDKDTGLIWARNASLIGETKSWQDAIDYCRNLEIPGWHFKGWRLPTQSELASLLDTSNSNPCLPTGHPFVNVITGWYYWSSTTYEINSSQAHYLSLADCSLAARSKSDLLWIIPVFGGTGQATGNW